MKKLLSFAASFAFLIAQCSSAYAAVPALVYNNFNWNFSSNVLPVGCNNLFLDATGNLAASSKLVVYGLINCGSFGYGVTGSAYIGNDGTLNMTLNVASGSQIVCARLNTNTLSGGCAVFNAAGGQIGTAFISYVP